MSTSGCCRQEIAEQEAVSIVWESRHRTMIPPVDCDKLCSRSRHNQCRAVRYCADPRCPKSVCSSSGGVNILFVQITRDNQGSQDLNRRVMADREFSIAGTSPDAATTETCSLSKSASRREESTLMASRPPLFNQLFVPGELFHKVWLR